MSTIVRGPEVGGLGDVIKTIKIFLDLAVECAKIVGNVLTEIAKALDVIKQDENTVELGDKAIQAEAEGIVPEKYETYQEYLQAVRDFKINPEKSMEISETDKLAKGAELIALCADEKLKGVNILGLAILVAIVFPPAVLTGPAMTTLGAIIAKNPSIVAALIGYLDGTGRNGKDLKAAQDTVTEVLRVSNPNISEEELKKQAASYRK